MFPVKRWFIDLISGFVWLFLKLRGFFVTKRGSFRVLLYHATSHEIKKNEDKSEVNVPPDIFVKQIDFLVKKGCQFVDLSRSYDILNGKFKCTETLILIHFDDALNSLLPDVISFMRERKLKGVLFVPTDFIDKGKCFPWMERQELLKPMTWDEVNQVSDVLELGSHSLTHRNMKLLNQEELEDESFRSKERIKEKTGKSVNSFSYPFGFVDSYDDKCKEALKYAGYKMAFCNVFGENKPGDDPFELKRMRISSFDIGFRLQMKIEGAYDWVDKVKAITIGSTKPRNSWKFFKSL